MNHDELGVLNLSPFQLIDDCGLNWSEVESL